MLVSQEDWYGGNIIQDIVQWNQDRSVYGPDFWDSAEQKLIPFGETTLVYLFL